MDFSRIAAHGHEQVLFCHNAMAGYRGIIAIHSTVRGPALGGTRLWHYATTEEAFIDALRLARGMTYKNALAGVPFGGGKAVILAHEGMDRERVFRAHARHVDTLKGRFITAEDVGTGVADVVLMRQETEYVACGPSTNADTGDPSPFTARGVLAAIHAAARHRWGSPALQGKTVAVQGCGNVGRALCRLLAAEGARLLVTDLDPARAAAVADEMSAEILPVAGFEATAADILAPCALGATLNAETIPTLQVEVVAGAANNQLAEDADGDRLAARGILYAPDYVANAGGVLSGMRGLLGWSPEQVRARIDGIHDTVLDVFARAEAEGITPARAADRLAEAALGG